MQRQNIEDKIPAKYKNHKLDVQNNKVISYKMSSKLLKINNIYSNKLQFYFPWIFEFLSQLEVGEGKQCTQVESDTTADGGKKSLKDYLITLLHK